MSNLDRERLVSGAISGIVPRGLFLRFFVGVHLGA